MKLAVLSGKGGAGKTLTAVNLADTLGHAVYVDCDVEEPNGRLFLKPQRLREKPVSTLLPVFDAAKCTGCRKCVEHCKFNALIYIKEKPMVFTEVCHSCGLCSLVCPEGAIREEENPVGHLEIGESGGVTVITGVLDPGEASGIPVISAALAEAKKSQTVVIDCPPGSACSVMESITDADFCILVAEPTAFGFHNFQMVHELATLLKKPCGVVINKQDAPYPPLEAYCREKHLPILAVLPYDPQVAALAAKGELVGRLVPAYQALFRQILQRIGGLVQ